MNISNIVGPLPRIFRRHKLVQLMLTLSPSSNVQKVKFNDGAELYADLTDPFPRSYFLTKSFDPEFFKIAVPFLSKGGVFFDVGANFGFCSFGLVNQLKGKVSEYHLFEANDEICDLLEKSKQLCPKEAIYIQKGCLSDVPGESAFFKKAGHLGGSHVSANSDYAVSNVVLDQYIKEQGVSEISFLKMDIEGYEPLALKGLEESLSKQLIQAAYVEVSEPNLKRYQFSPEDCFEPFRKNDYRLFFVKDSELQEIPETEKLTLKVYGHSVTVSEIKSFPNETQTDVLALPKTSPFLK